MPEFVYQDILPIGADDTAYRRLDGDDSHPLVSTYDAGGRRSLQVDPEALAGRSQPMPRDLVRDALSWKSAS